MEQIYKKYIFFRDDDVAGLTKNLERLLDIFISAKVPIHLSIIPNRLTKECKDFLISKIIKYKDLVEIGQHGFDHKDHSGYKNKWKRYEFGPRRSYLQQRKDIHKGKIILENYFKKRINVFTPPWHRYDENTLKSIIEENIPIISTDHKSQIFDIFPHTETVFVNINFNKVKNNGSWFVEDSREIFKKIFSIHEQAIGILLHHDKFSNQKEFLLLKNLIYILKNTKFIEFIPLSKVPVLCKSQNQNFRNALFYYLTYQFVPKPLTIIKNHINTVHKDYDYSYITKPKIINDRENTICKNLYNRLKEVIKKQLPNRDEPIGLLLSGGIDSAAILHILRDLTDRKIYTLTGAYHKNAANLTLTNWLAEQFNTTHDNLIIEPAELKKIDEIYNNGYIPQPIGDDGLLSFYLMIKKLKENCSTIFAGDGADCLFSGLKMHLTNIENKDERDEDNDFEHYKFGDIFLNKQELKVFFNQKSNVIDLAAPLKAVCSKILTRDVLKRQVLIDLHFLVKNRIDYLIYPSKICKVELFLPFLDKKFIDFVVGIPSAYLIKGKQQKYILRKTFQDKLPQEVINRGKEGFSPPFSLWYEANKEFVIRKLIMSIRLGIPKDYIKYLISIIPKSVCRDNGMKIWLILNLVSWHNSIHNKSCI